MGRRNARKLAFYLLFQYDFVNNGDYEDVKNIFLTVNYDDISEKDREYII